MLGATPTYRRALLIARVSSDEQAEEGFSLDAQDRRLREYCSAMGITIVDAGREEGISGVSTQLDQRPGLMRAIDLADRGAIDVLITHKVDRLARNIRIALEVISRLRARNVAYVSASEGIDFSTPVGELILTILASFAQWYSSNLSADVRKSKIEHARLGISNGRPPLGYHYDPPGSWRRGSRWGGEEERHCECTDRRSWTTCDQAAPVIAHIFSEYASGTVSVGDLVR